MEVLKNLVAQNFSPNSSATPVDLGIQYSYIYIHIYSYVYIYIDTCDVCVYIYIFFGTHIISSIFPAFFWRSILLSSHLTWARLGVCVVTRGLESGLGQFGLNLVF